VLHCRVEPTFELRGCWRRSAARACTLVQEALPLRRRASRPDSNSLIVLEADQFGDPEPRRVEHFQHGAIRGAPVDRKPWAPPAAITSGPRSATWQGAGRFSASRSARLGLANQSLAHHEAEESAETRQLPGRRRGPDRALDAGRK